jgi:hypothetical protein
MTGHLINTMPPPVPGFKIHDTLAYLSNDVLSYILRINRSLMGNIMRKQYNKTIKTVGGQTARLLAELYDRSQTTFTLSDVERITGLRGISARTLIHKATKRGLISRLKSGLFVVVPPELGSNTPVTRIWSRKD